MSEQPGSLAAALVQLQAALPRIVKDDTAQAGNRKTKYANLSRITEAIFPLLTSLGLYWVCQPTMHETFERMVLRYRLVHAATGEQIGGDYPLPTTNSQVIGGAITYARRYALCAVLGIAPAEDDDDAETEAKEAADRQNMRTRYISEERASIPPRGPRPASKGKELLPDDPWTREPAEEAP